MEQQTRELKLPFRSLRDRKRWAADEAAAEDRMFDPSRIWPPGSPVE